VELLSGGVVDIVSRCPLERDSIDDLAREYEAEPSELLALVDELAGDGVLVIHRP
jgi:hypothetical protein